MVEKAPETDSGGNSWCPNICKLVVTFSVNYLWIICIEIYEERSCKFSGQHKSTVEAGILAAMGKKETKLLAFHTNIILTHFTQISHIKGWSIFSFKKIDQTPNIISLVSGHSLVSLKERSVHSHVVRRCGKNAAGSRMTSWCKGCTQGSVRADRLLKLHRV